MADKLPV